MPVLSPSDEQQSDEVGLHSPPPVQRNQEQVWKQNRVMHIDTVFISYF